MIRELNEDEILLQQNNLIHQSCVNRKTGHTFIVKLETDNPDCKEYLSNVLNQFCQDTGGNIEIYELNKAGI